VQSPFSNTKFRNLFVGCWLLWMALHMQVLVWYGFTLPVAAADSAISNVLLVVCCVLLTSILQYYLPRNQRYSYILGLCAVLTALWLGCSSGLMHLLLGSRFTYASFNAYAIVVRMVIAFLIIGCTALVSMVWYILADQQDDERRRREAEQLAKETELYKLRQQLQPHFLFNSLNSINALVSLNPALARTMIQHLSDFLRGTIKQEENNWILLEEELKHLQLYLDIEKVRFGHRLGTEIINKAAGCRLPAMLLQPIVENAIKFGLYDTTGVVKISLSAERENNHLIICVQNPFDAANTAHRGTGFGLSSVQRRLYLLFARADLLQTQSQDQQFITTLKIPQDDQSNHN
jgi:two-component system LytT family sensor kinase